jgi:hypothetical protein
MTEARRDSCNCRTMGCPLFYRFGMACDVCVTYSLLSHYCYVNIVLIRLKQIDVKWLNIVINL